MSKDTHEEVPNLPTKTVLTLMGDQLGVSSIHYVIVVPQFHYDGVHTVGNEFY